MEVFVLYVDWMMGYRAELNGQVYVDGLGAYLPILHMVAVELWAPGRKSCARKIFSNLNAEDKAHGRPDGLVRSMSAGDIVLYEDGDIWVVKGSGWVRREDLRTWGKFKVLELKNKHKACCICHVYKPQVTTSIDPYLHDIEGIVQEDNFCPECYDQRRGDI